MKHLLLLAATLLLFACTEERPEALLDGARSRTDALQSLSYELHEIWDNRYVGTADTAVSTVAYYRNEKLTWGYDFICESADYTSWLIGKESGWLLHEEKLAIVRTPEENIEHFSGDRESSSTVFTSPFYLLSLTDWEYKADTTFVGHTARMYASLRNYEEQDSVTYRQYYHLFIEPESLRVLGMQLVHKVDDRINQAITFWYEKSEEDQLAPLNFTPPIAYSQTSETAYDESYEWELIAIGQAAPDFTATTLDGETFTLSDYRGKRVLLDFSFIGCGGCERAMKDFNRPDFQLADGMTGVYLSPHNKPEEIRKHYKEKGMPFSAIPEAREPVRLYGISAYPTFVIVDEVGNVAQIETGYSEVFIERLRKL